MTSLQPAGNPPLPAGAEPASILMGDPFMSGSEPEFPGSASGRCRYAGHGGLHVEHALVGISSSFSVKKRSAGEPTEKQLLENTSSLCDSTN